MQIFIHPQIATRLKVCTSTHVHFENVTYVCILAVVIGGTLTMRVVLLYDIMSRVLFKTVRQCKEFSRVTNFHGFCG